MAHAFGARDFDAVSRCYAHDAVLLAPGRPAAVGRAAIALELRAAFAAPHVDVVVRTTRIDLSPDGEFASAWGSGLTTVADPAAGGAVRRITSKWLAVYRRDPDGWKVAADAFNTDDASALEPGDEP